jgi:hypothetical protein
MIRQIPHYIDADADIVDDNSSGEDEAEARVLATHHRGRLPRLCR